MKTILVTVSGLALSLLSFNSVAALDCSELKGCDRKFCEIEQQIEYAKQADNPRKVDGLNKALAQARANCSDADLKQELMDDIRETEDDIAEYEADLLEAEASGNTKKVKKYQDKLQDEKHTLETLQQELSELSGEN